MSLPGVTQLERNLESGAHVKPFNMEFIIIDVSFRATEWNADDKPFATTSTTARRTARSSTAVKFCESTTAV